MKQNLMEIAQPKSENATFLLIFNPLCVGGQLQVNLGIFFHTFQSYLAPEESLEFLDFVCSPF